MGRKVSFASAVAVLSLLSVFVLVSAECPNGCSGYGDCMAKDMCNCYKNYQGNDCADRTCPFGRAHVDTPKGDINMDKDRLTVGYVLTDSQQDPAGTHEYFNPDAAADEAHFYMECSNKGICDRSTGLCTCFDGYEGAGCRRTTCPGKCNGHGTCESIRELGVKAAGTLFGAKGRSGAVNYDLWDGNSTYGCRCDPWYHGPDCNKRSCKVGVDPLFMGVGVPTFETFIVHAGAATLTSAWIRLRVFDYYGESYITRKIPITVAVLITVPATDPDKTAAQLANSAAVTATANANAAAVTAAIKAVPNLTFSKAPCTRTPTLATDTGFFSVRPATATDGMSVVCQFIDNPGKMRIPQIADSGGFGATPFLKVTTTTQQGFDDEWFTVQSADVTSSTLPVAVDFLSINTAATSTLTNAYQLVKVEDNIVLVKSVTTTVLALEYGLKHSIGSSSPVFTAPAGLLTIITTGPDTFAPVAVGDDFFTFAGALTAAPYAAGDLLVFHNQFFYVQQVYKDAVPNWIVKLDKPFGGSAVDGNAVAAATGVRPHMVTVGLLTTTAGPAISVSLGATDDFFTFATSATAPFAAGDLIMFHNKFFRVQSVVLTTVWTVNVYRAYGTAVTAAAAEIVYKVTVSSGKTGVYKYVSECSGRGMCGYDTGICTCFKGYTDDDCDTQNILAV